MDIESVFKLKPLLRKPRRCLAVLEITMTGPTLEFEEDTFYYPWGCGIFHDLKSMNR